MKRILSFLIVVILLFSLAAPVYAAGGGNDALISALDGMLKERFQDRYRLRQIGRLFIVDSWSDADTKLVQALKDGNEEAAEIWAGTVESVKQVVVSLQDLFDKQGDGTLVALWNVVDSATHQEIYLSVGEGEVLYNCADADTVSVSAAPSTPVPSVSTPSPSGMTTRQKNAVGSAESYLKYSSFSREGLIKQLEFEGYPHDDAVFAVDHITVDWYAQAVKTAESYLKYSSFSRDGLIKQLEFEGFTHDQAVYAVGQVGY